MEDAPDKNVELKNNKHSLSSNDDSVVDTSAHSISISDYTIVNRNSAKVSTITYITLIFGKFSQNHVNSSKSREAEQICPKNIETYSKTS